MKIDEFFNKKTVIDLSFFNFSNAVTAAYFANKNLEVLKVNDNFKKFADENGLIIKDYKISSLKQNDVFEDGLIKRIYLTNDGEINLSLFNFRFSV